MAFGALGVPRANPSAAALEAGEGAGVSELSDTGSISSTRSRVESSDNQTRRQVGSGDAGAGQAAASDVAPAWSSDDLQDSDLALRRLARSAHLGDGEDSALEDAWNENEGMLEGRCDGQEIGAGMGQLDSTDAEADEHRVQTQAREPTGSAGSEAAPAPAGSAGSEAAPAPASEPPARPAGASTPQQASGPLVEPLQARPDGAQTQLGPVQPASAPGADAPAAAQDQRRRWDRVKDEILRAQPRDGGSAGRPRAPVGRAGGQEEVAADSDADSDFEEGIVKMIRFLAMPDSSDPDYEVDMTEVADMWEAEKRRRPGIKGFYEEREEETRREQLRSRGIRYLRLGDYWLEDWSSDSALARPAQGGGESQASALTRLATRSVATGDFAAAEMRLQEALKAHKYFCPALNNLGAIYAHYADTNTSAPALPHPRAASAPGPTRAAAACSDAGNPAPAGADGRAPAAAGDDLSERSQRRKHAGEAGVPPTCHCPSPPPPKTVSTGLATPGQRSGRAWGAVCGSVRACGRRSGC